jgi:hypothetical protein
MWIECASMNRANPKRSWVTYFQQLCNSLRPANRIRGEMRTDLRREITEV